MWNERLAEDNTDAVHSQMQPGSSNMRSANTIDDSYETHGLAQDLDDFLQSTISDPRSIGTGNDTLDWLNFLGVPDQPSSPAADRADTMGSGLRFRFLYNFTSRTGLSSTFECGSLAQRQRLLGVFAVQHTDGDFLNAANGLHDTTNEDHAFKVSWLFDPLVIKVHEIVNRLKEIGTSKGHGSVSTNVWTLESERRCIEFFSPASIRSFLASYWALWHPNVNFVHKPTFDPAKSKACLLATMVVIGQFETPRATCHNLTTDRGLRFSGPGSLRASKDVV